MSFIDDKNTTTVACTHHTFSVAIDTKVFHAGYEKEYVTHCEKADEKVVEHDKYTIGALGVSYTQTIDKHESDVKNNDNNNNNDDDHSDVDSHDGDDYYKSDNSDDHEPDAIDDLIGEYVDNMDD